MRSSTVASIVTVLLSVHGAVGLNHRRYPTTLATHTIAASPSVYRRHDQDDKGRNRDDGGEYGFGGNYDDDKLEPTASANEGEDKPSKPKFTQSLTVTISEDSTAASSEGAAAVEQTPTETVSSSVVSRTPATENEKNVSTSDNSNLGASAGEAGGNGNGMQLSFVPTTVFATGEAPTVTVTAAPRTITQVQACEAAAPSSALAPAEPVTITVTQTAPQQETSPASTITITESAPQQPAPEPVTVVVTQTAAQQPAPEQLTITQQQFVTQTTIIHASATGIKQIDAVVPEGAKSTMPAQNQNQGEYTKTISQTLDIRPTPIPAGSEGVQCQCACPCESKVFSSTRFPVISGTPPVEASMPEVTGADEPTTTVRLELTQTTLQTIVMSGTSEASAAITTSAEAIELDPVVTAAPIIIASSAFDEPVISSIPIASFGKGETTPGVIGAEPTARASEIMDTSIALDTSTSAAAEASGTLTASSAPSEETAPFFTTTLDAPLATPEIGAIPKSQANGDQADVDTEIVLATSTIASSTVYETAVITASSVPAEETALFFTTTLDAPLETPEIGAIPKDQASGEAERSKVDTEIVLATSTIASSTVTPTATVTPSANPAPVADEQVAPVFTTTIDAPLETPEIGAVPKKQAGQAGEFLQGGEGRETPKSVESGAPSQTNAQAEAVVTSPAAAVAQGEGAGGDEEVDINKYTLKSKIELGNMG